MTDPSSPSVLQLPAVLRARLWNHARAELPRECVGVLGGPAGSARAEALYPLRNVAPDPGRAYLVDPLELLRALRAMRAGGLRLAAIYHSHPRGPALPSPSDVRLARYGVPYLIADVARGELRGFLLPELVEVELR